MLSDVAGHYKGAYPIPELMKLTYRELMFWYKIMEVEIIEKNILFDLAQKKKQPPTPQSLKRMVDKRLKELKGGLSE